MHIKIGKFNKGLEDIIEGFLYSYRKFGLAKGIHASHSTHAEIKYFYDLGEMLGFWSELEARSKNSDQPADLVWVDDYDGNYYNPKDLVLFFERETRGWEKIKKTADKFFKKKWRTTVPMGVAIIDNVPKAKIEEAVEIFKKGFESKKLFSELALLIYQKVKDNEKTKPIIATVFSNGNGKKVKTIEAKFEFVGKYSADEESGFTIVSFH